MWDRRLRCGAAATPPVAGPGAIPPSRENFYVLQIRLYLATGELSWHHQFGGCREENFIVKVAVAHKAAGREQRAAQGLAFSAFWCLLEGRASKRPAFVLPRPAAGNFAPARRLGFQRIERRRRRARGSKRRRRARSGFRRNGAIRDKRNRPANRLSQRQTLR